MKNYDVIIAGGGVMGTAAACEMARTGAKVALIDRSTIPNELAASTDYSKAFRFAYPDPFYVRLAVQALELWRHFEEEIGSRLITPTGLVLLGLSRPSFETDCYQALLAAGVETEMLEAQDVVKRFPQLNHEAFSYAVIDPAGAILHAESAVRALAGLARRLGANLIEEEPIVRIEASREGTVLRSRSGQDLACDRVLIAAGPWTRTLLPELDRFLNPTRQEVVYFGLPSTKPNSKPSGADRLQDPAFSPPRFPILIELGSGFYLFPDHGSGIKLGNHNKGPRIDPNDHEKDVGEDFVVRCRGFLKKFTPALAGWRVLEKRLCIYNNTPDDDFIIDWHPDSDKILIATGFSGHGFKFGPVVGRLAADLLVSGRTSYDIDRFRMSRFDKPLREEDSDRLSRRVHNN